jgi:hypothetical protein
MAKPDMASLLQRYQLLLIPSAFHDGGNLRWCASCGEARRSVLVEIDASAALGEAERNITHFRPCLLGCDL